MDDTDLLWPLGERDLEKLVKAGLGTAARASTYAGQIPALRCSAEIANAGRAFLESEEGDLADYLVRRFRFRVVR